jgi:hypothetical protein
MTITREQLDEWRELCDAATEGPWTVDMRVGIFVREAPLKRRVIASAESENHESNERFIATSRTAMPALLDEVDRLRAENAVLQEQADFDAADHNRCMGVMQDRIAELERSAKSDAFCRRTAATLETWVAMNTGFTGNPPYVGDAGLVLALDELKGRAEKAEVRAAELRAENVRLLAANKDCLLHFNVCRADLVRAEAVVPALRDLIADVENGHADPLALQHAMDALDVYDSNSDPDGLRVRCHDCDRPYGDEHGFPDLVIADDAWRTISPDGDGNGLLCPSCICKRLHEAGLSEVPHAFKSGPLYGHGSAERLANQLNTRLCDQLHEALSTYYKANT